MKNLPRCLFLCGWLLCLPAARADSAEAVAAASASVYRLWLGLPLPPEFSLQAGTSYLRDLETRGYAAVSLGGLYAAGNGSKAAPKPLSGQGVVFQYGGSKYLLVATGSAYAVSAQGDLLTHARLADVSARGQVMFIGKDGMRYRGGSDSGRVFVLTAAVPKAVMQPTQLKFADKAADVAVVRAENLKKIKPIPLADAKFSEISAPVFALGMEGRSDQLEAKQGAADAVGAHSYLQAVAREGLLQRKVKRGQTELWQHGAEFSGSMSGGPLVNACGQAVGILQAAANDGKQGVYAAISESTAAHWLKKHQIPFQQASGRCGGAAAQAANIADKAVDVAKDMAEKPKQWLSLGALLAAGLAATVVAWKLLKWILRRPRRPRPEPRPHNEPSPPSRPKPTVKHHAPSPQTEIKTAPTGGAAYLKALSGSLKDVALPPGKILSLGRAAENDAVFASPHISNRHAKVWYDGQNVYVEDTGSTNGTLINGRRINGREQLAQGDTLQLTENPQLAAFRVEMPVNVQAVLRSVAGGLPEIRLSVGQAVTLGRAADNTVCIGHRLVSGHHCRLILQPDGSVWVEDAGSTNGTFIDSLDRRISREQLHAGQTLYLADTETAFRLETR
ncbi:MAG: FHA domain-containing protein [Conchiformibius sp.]|nr:FHA domain-containing protein [Conchiformibius sp.]